MSCCSTLILSCLATLYFLSPFFFFFKQKTAYEMRISDWSSDVCSSDLLCRDDGELVRSGDMSCNDPQTPVQQQNWIKRVIGLPGDTIEARGAELLINGQPVKADLIGPYVGNPQRSVDQIMLNMGATVWTEHLGQIGRAHV